MRIVSFALCVQRQIAYKVYIKVEVVLSMSSFSLGGVFIDDPKGVFILRWYKEVDANGNELNGYQRKECKFYKLMANNDGATFAWTSNLQIVSKVFLKKSLVHSRAYTFAQSDKRMLNGKVARL